jgi:hypothetical protein
VTGWHEFLGVRGTAATYVVPVEDQLPPGVEFVPLESRRRRWSDEVAESCP